MSRVRLTAALFGAVFGFFLVWSGLSDPDVIRRMLLLQQAYVYLVMASAVAIGFVGVRVLRALRLRAVVTGTPIGWTAARPEPRHVRGAVLFGLGWGVANTCPGPVAAQIATGIWWSAFTVGGIFLGVKLYLVRQRPRVPAAEPARASA